MINKEEFKLKYWNYFLTLEDEFISIEKIIPIDNINHKTFSLHYMKIYFSICSEIDVIFKEYVEYNKWHNFNGDDNFQKYREIININIPQFSNQVVLFSTTKELSPFNDWKNNQKLIWWNNYNDIKHNRTKNSNGIENFKNANQENILNAFAALYQIEMYFYKSIIDITKDKNKLKMPVPHSKRLRIKDWADNIDLIDNRYILYVNNDNGHLILEGDINC